MTRSLDTSDPAPASRDLTPVRVAEPDAWFWVIKILTTGAGEAISDAMVRTFDPVIVVLTAAVVFVGCFAVQFTSRRYRPWRYWLFVTMVAVFGTMVADVTHIVLGVPYLLSASAFAVALTVVLIVWRRVEGTISIHSVRTARTELFYWMTVLATFALGTALGDLMATTFHLGYLGSGLVVAACFAIPIVAYRLGAPAVAMFWFAYILTRPLGASFADFLGVSHARGGLDLGSLAVGGVALVLIVIGVGILQVRSASPRLGARRTVV